MPWISELITDECRQAFSATPDTESFLKYLRERGSSRLASMAILAHLSGRRLSDAKLVVHHSATWSDTRDEAERFYASLEEAFEELIAGVDLDDA